MRVNLLPDRFKKKPLSVKQILRLALPTLIIVFLIGLYIMMSQEIKTLEQEVRLLESENTAMETVIREIRLHERRIEDLQGHINAILDVQYQLDWSDLVVELGYLVTDGIQITNFQLSENNEVTIEGLVTEFALITYFIYRLDNSPYFTDNVMKTTDLATINGKEEFKIVGKLAKGESR